MFNQLHKFTTGLPSYQVGTKKYIKNRGGKKKKEKEPFNLH